MYVIEQPKCQKDRNAKDTHRRSITRKREENTNDLQCFLGVRTAATTLESSQQCIIVFASVFVYVFVFVFVFIFVFVFVFVFMALPTPVQ